MPAKIMSRPPVQCLALLLSIFTLSAHSAPTYHLVDLGANVRANDINAHGVIAGTDSQGAAVFRDGEWHHRTSGDSATGIDGQGEVIGYKGNDLLFWPANGSSPIDVIVPHSKHNYLADVAQATVVLNSAGSLNAFAQCFIWTPDAGAVKIAPLSTSCIAVGINDSGQVAGSSEAPDGRSEEAFIWKSGSFQFLGVLPGGNFSEAAAINRKGHVALNSQRSVRNGDVVMRAALWNGQRLKDLGTIDKADYCRSIAINDGDEVIGEYSAGLPFLYTGGEMLPIGPLVENLDGWDLGGIRAIANDGTIIGNGTLEGIPHAYRLDRQPIQ